jgi:C4-dicarboxylate-specific signal transduction histidine kinase
MVDLGELGQEAGRLLLRLLAGETVAVRVPSAVQPRAVADWERLKHWRLDEGGLPPGSRVLNRQPTAWERFRWTIAAALGVILALSLVVVGLLVEQRRRRQVQAALEDRLRFEGLLTEISNSLAPLSAREGPDAEASLTRGVEERIREGLRRVAGAVGAEGASLWQLSATAEAIGPLRGWPEDSAARAPAIVPLDRFPYARARALQGMTVRFRTLDELPPEASEDRASFARLGVRSLASAPLEVGGAVTGVIWCMTFQREAAWSNETVQRLRMVGEIFAGALARAGAEDALQASEALSQAVLASLPSEVAVIDREGVILHVNEQWRTFAREHNADGCPRMSVGANYLEVCRRAAGQADRTAARALEIIEAVLDGKDRGETLEYLAGQPGEERWFEMTVKRLDGAGGAALIIHQDITAAKRTAEETRRALSEIAHMDRVAAVGQLASSLAHELNQPLAAILANAQAARRWLAGGSPSLDELRDVVQDIIADDQRATEVISRIRGLLRKEEPRKDVVDLNAIVRETTRLVASDAQLRGGSISVDLSSELPKVRADAIQLQQVLLNLLVNGLHAVTGSPPHRRRVIVRTAALDGSVEVAVQDTGPGIPESALGRIFEPFVTTKREGLGIGLAISHSIIEAYGGRIWAENDPDGGAVFRFLLPLERPPA